MPERLVAEFFFPNFALTRLWVLGFFITKGMDEVDVGVEMEVPMLWGGPCLRWCFGFSCGLAGHYGSEVFLLCSLLGFAVVLMVRLLKVHQLSSSLQQWYLMVVEFQLTFMFESFSSSWLVEDSGEAVCRGSCYGGRAL